jgi:hypothetical protein
MASCISVTAYKLGRNVLPPSSGLKIEAMSYFEK